MFPSSCRHLCPESVVRASLVAFAKMSGQQPQDNNPAVTTGAAKSRRVRRRLLSQAFDRGERTFGDEEDAEQLDSFLARGRAVGGAAREEADAKQSIGLAMPWPTSKQAFTNEAWRSIVAYVAERAVTLKLDRKPSGGYLSLRTEEVDDPDDPGRVIDVFWFLFKHTQELVDDDVMEQMVIPRRWAPYIAQTEVSSLGGPLPLCFDAERRGGRGRFDPAEALGQFALTVSLATGRVESPQRQPFAVLGGSVRAGMTQLRDIGARLLAPCWYPGTLDWPAGLANLGRRSETAVVRECADMGSPWYALPQLRNRMMNALRVRFATKVRLYTCGYQSLHVCYPGKGYEWLQRGSREAIDYMPAAIGELEGIQVGRFVDCRPLRSEHSLRPRGHLGFCQRNIGLMLGNAQNRRWRVQRYVELWVLLQSTVMVNDGGNDMLRDGMLHVVMRCRQGKHRSVVWMLVECRIFQACGIDCEYVNTCKWMQLKEHCQAGRYPGACSECGCVRNDQEHYPDKALAQAIINEFFETVLILETRV